MMVNRYFGSKEKLFAEVVAGIMTTPIDPDRRHLASRSLGALLAAGIVAQTGPGASPLDGFLIMMHSASSAQAAAIARAQIEQHYQRATDRRAPRGLSRRAGGHRARHRRGPSSHAAGDWTLGPGRRETRRRSRRILTPRLRTTRRPCRGPARRRRGLPHRQN